MKILFANYHHLDSNSGIHIFNLANQLTRLGAKCVVCVPSHKELTVRLGDALFETVNLSDVRHGRVPADFDLIHAWTPREVVRKIAVQLLAMRPVPYLVHLEDNEEYIIESVARVPAAWLPYVPDVLTPLVLPHAASHPRRYREFLTDAAGLTVIIEALGKFCPPTVPRQVIWAGYQEDLHWASPPDVGYKHRLGIARNEFVVAYTGNVHLAHQQDVSNLYKAVGILNERGVPAKLVRTGTDYVRHSPHNDSAIKEKYCVELGHIPRRDLPSVLSIADVLVQPGKPGQFNDYRFPSKVPEYLASGKPVILPRTNIGLYLKNYEECLFLEEGTPSDIAAKIEMLLSNEDLRRRIGAGGRAFAEKNLQWGHIASCLHSFYKTVLDTRRL
jgi:glycosyltransferase involved in cell wall biosynthesis